jgi:hypothetical protein
MQKQLKEAAEATKNLAENFDALKEGGKKLLEIVGVVEAVKTGFEKFKSIAEAGEALQNLSARTGIAVSELTKLQFAFKLSGLGADAVAGTMAKMQRAIEKSAEGGKDKFAALK